jgi:hypothetical protein
MNARRLRGMPPKGGRVASSLPGTHARTQTELGLLVQEKERMARVRGNWIEYQRRTEAEMAAVAERIARLRARLEAEVASRPPRAPEGEGQGGGEPGGEAWHRIDLEY